MLLSVIHKPLHALVSVSLVAVWGLILLPIWWLFLLISHGRGGCSGIQHFIIASCFSFYRPACVRFPTAPQQDDVAKFEVR